MKNRQRKKRRKKKEGIANYKKNQKKLRATKRLLDFTLYFDVYILWSGNFVSP